MNNAAYVAQWVGTISILALFIIKLIIVSNNKAWAKSGRVAVLWTTMYVFFLFVLRLVSITGAATTEELRIISGFSAVLPLLGVGSHLLLAESNEEDAAVSIDEAKQLLHEAKQIRTEAVNTLVKAKKDTAKNDKQQVL